MHASAHEAYLESQVLTATPQKLRLLLIDGAMRRAQQTLAAWEAERWEEAGELLIRCRQIVVELLTVVRDDDAVPTARWVRGIYAWLFRTLTEAGLSHDRAKLAEAIGVLQEERETWRLVCEQMPEAPVRPRNINEEVTASCAMMSEPPEMGGFSLDG